MQKSKKHLRKFRLLKLKKDCEFLEVIKDERLFNCFYVVLKKLKLLAPQQDRCGCGYDNYARAQLMVIEFHKLNRSIGDDSDAVCQTIHWAAEQWGNVDNKKVVKAINAVL